MKKLKNPYDSMEGYNCFGCSPNNQQGLRMEFFEDADEVVSYWDPEPHFQGWVNVLHGGIQSTLMDEIASWVVLAQCKTSGVTARMEVDYKKPVYTSKGKITIRAKLLETTKRIAHIDVKLIDGDGIICTEGVLQYFIYPQEIAKRKFHYSDIEYCCEK
ncbi:MAG: PaaI family thioesterase [Bacteroidales bacterium]|nr:PaaI family thioesterase [Bacteroidales bacterium]